MEQEEGLLLVDAVALCEQQKVVWNHRDGVRNKSCNRFAWFLAINNNKTCISFVGGTGP